MKRILTPMVLCAAMSAPLAADDMALVLTNRSYDEAPAARGTDGLDGAAEALRRAGFEVTELRDATRADAAARIADFADDAEDADRLVIVIAGHVVTDGVQSWLLTRSADDPGVFDVGASGHGLRALYELAASRPGASAVLIAPEEERLRLGRGLSVGLAPIDPPQGVAVFTGPARGLLAMLREDLLRPGQSLARTADRLPSNVSATGFISDSVAFLPAAPQDQDKSEAAPEPEGNADEAREAALDLDRDARRQVQRDLALLGHDPRGIDGIFGPGTRGAIESWQRAENLDVTGYLDARSYEELRNAARAEAEALEREAARRQAEQDRLDAEHWRKTGEAATASAARAYLERYPDGLYSERARAALVDFEAERRADARQADRTAWDDARTQDTVEAYRAYLDAFPRGTFRDDAEARIRQLRDAASDEVIEAARNEEARVAGNGVTRFLVEQRLAQLGFDPGRVDNSFDSATRRAIRRFQQSRDLEVTGYVTQATMVRLLAGG